MAGNGQMVIDLDKKRMTAMAQKDIATLNSLLSDDLIYTHSTARLDTKQSLIGNMEFGVDSLHRGRALRRQGSGSGGRGGTDRLVPHQRCVAGASEQLQRPLYRRLRQQRWPVADGDLAIHPAARVSPLPDLSH